jgi:hypothetical protein
LLLFFLRRCGDRQSLESICLWFDSDGENEDSCWSCDKSELFAQHLSASRVSDRNRVFFNKNGMIQICDSASHNLAVLQGHHGMEVDVAGFSGIRPEIEVGASAERGRYALNIPPFVSAMIERGQCTVLKAVESFAAILKLFKPNVFTLLSGLESRQYNWFILFP